MCSSDYRGCVHPDNVILDDRLGDTGSKIGTGGGAGGILRQRCQVLYQPINIMKSQIITVHMTIVIINFAPFAPYCTPSRH